MVPESPSSNYTGISVFIINDHELHDEKIVFPCLDKIVLVFEVVPIEEKWRNIQSHGGLGGVTFSRPGKFDWKDQWICPKKLPNSAFSTNLFLLSIEFVWIWIVGITPGRTEFWSDGSDTSDITILTGELSYSDWLIVNKTLWDPANIDSTTGQPSMIVTIDSWSKIFHSCFPLFSSDVSIFKRSLFWFCLCYIKLQIHGEF